MNRVAVCLAGELRSVYYSLIEMKKFFQNYFENYKIDYFIYTTNTNKSLWYSDYRKLYPNIKKYEVTYEKIQFVKNILEPKEFIIDNNDENIKKYIYNIWDKEKTNNFVDTENSFKQFFYKQECVKLVKNYKNNNDLEYDIIVVARPDLLFYSNEKIKFYKDESFLKDKRIYIPFCNVEWNSDWFYIGTYSNIISLFEYYIDNLLKIIDKNYKNPWAERLNYFVMKENNFESIDLKLLGYESTIIKEELIELCNIKFNSDFEKYQYILKMYFYGISDLYNNLINTENIKLDYNDYKKIINDIIIYNKFNIFNNDEKTIKNLVLKSIKNKWEIVDYSSPRLNSFNKYIRSYKKNEINSLLEIGIFNGDSTYVFANSELFSFIDIVDLWENGYDKNDDTSEKGNMIEAEKNVNELIKKYSFITKYKQSSTEYLLNCNKKYDLVYIDANHQFEHVLSDLILAKKVSKYISGHDFTWTGVQNALKVFCRVSTFDGYPIKVFQDDSWFIDIDFSQTNS